MRVLQVIDSLHVGGAEKIAVMIANLAAENGEISGLVTLVSPGKLHSELNYNVEFYDLDRVSKWNISAAKRFIFLLGKYDVIQVHLRHNLKWVLFWTFVFRKKINIIFHDHNNSILKKNILYLIQWNKIAHVFVNQNLFNLQNSKGEEFHNSYFLPNYCIPAEMIGEYKKYPNQIRIVIVSNLRKIKKIEFALELLNSMIKSRPIMMDIYYSNFDHEYFTQLKDYINNNNLGENVNFILGESEPAKFYFKYDLGLHTSPLESGPLTILEYMANGLPFISFNTGQSIELIREDFPEFISYTFKIQEWIEKVNLIYENGREFYIKKLMGKYNDYYSPEKYYKSWKKILIENQS